MIRKPKFTLDEAQQAADDWGFNCGPAAIAAVCGMTLAELRPHLCDFESRRYTNPTLMCQILANIKAPVLEIIRLNAPFEMARTGRKPWPVFGLARVQWEGPWTNPGVPMRVRYRRTHWIGVSCGPVLDLDAGGWEEPSIFDVNCMCVGGWVPLSEWEGFVVPWLLTECVPKANGKWHLTHVIEIHMEEA